MKRSPFLVPLATVLVLAALLLPLAGCGESPIAGLTTATDPATTVTSLENRPSTTAAEVTTTLIPTTELTSTHASITHPQTQSTGTTPATSEVSAPTVTTPEVSAPTVTTPTVTAPPATRRTIIPPEKKVYLYPNTWQLIWPTDDRIEYAGQWQETSHSLVFFMLAYSGTDNEVKIRFAGTRIRYFAYSGPERGIVGIDLDGQPYEADLYHYTAGKRTVWTSPVLEDGVHTLRIFETGEKNPASTGYHMTVYAFELIGLLLD